MTAADRGSLVVGLSIPQSQRKTQQGVLLLLSFLPDVRRVVNLLTLNFARIQQPTLRCYCRPQGTMATISSPLHYHIRWSLEQM